MSFAGLGYIPNQRMRLCCNAQIMTDAKQTSTLMEDSLHVL